MCIAKRYLLFSVVLGIFALVPVLTVGAGGHATAFVFTALDCALVTPLLARCGSDVPPGFVSTSLQGINDRGDISGSVFDISPGGVIPAGTARPHGFVLRRGQSTAIVIDYPGAAWTRVWGVNAQGDVVGTYGYGVPNENSYHGFVRSRTGEITDIHYPGHLYE